VALTNKLFRLHNIGDELSVLRYCENYAGGGGSGKDAAAGSYVDSCTV